MPLLDNMDDVWMNVNGADAIGLYVANDPNTEQLRACFLCPIPQRSVGLCVNCSYMPQSFWTNVVGQVWQDQLTINCNVLINWARVASTYGPPNATVVVGLRVPLANKQLVARR
jgi:hypothetical protein